MAHHKRKRPKHQRAGCIMCKPWKDERSGGLDDEKVSVQRKLQEDPEDELGQVNQEREDEEEALP